MKRIKVGEEFIIEYPSSPMIAKIDEFGCLAARTMKKRDLQ